MGYKVDFHPLAEVELDEALSWYESQRTGLGQEFFNDYLEIEARLMESPEQFPIVLDNLRMAVFPKFPYSAFFVILPGAVLIYAIFHQKRNPEVWAERL
ncbi:MAG: type II toxin-antitoxin system RelE/ParE family toxin [Saprospiraceae bacterium]